MEVAKFSRTCVQATIDPSDVTIYGENKSNGERPISLLAVDDGATVSTISPNAEGVGR